MASKTEKLMSVDPRNTEIEEIEILEQIPQEAVIFAHPLHSHWLAAISGHNVVAQGRHIAPADVLPPFDGDLSSNSVRVILERYDVDYILLRKEYIWYYETPYNWEEIRSSLRLAPTVYENEKYILLDAHPLFKNDPSSSPP
jgi:hypothetical protein